MSPGRRGVVGVMRGVIQVEDAGGRKRTLVIVVSVMSESGGDVYRRVD